MAGYIGKSQGVTQVDGYNRTEADDRYVNASGDTMTGTLSVTGVDRNEDALRVGASSAGTGYGIRIGASGATDPLEIWREHSSGDQMQLSVDYYGRVTMPYQPFMVLGATSYTTANNADLQFATTYQSRGLSWNTSTNSFTVPVSGVYTFSVSARLATTVLNYMYFRLKVNGSSYPSNEMLILQKPNTLDSFQSINTSFQAHLTANDSISISINYNGTSSYTVHTQTWMSVALLG